MLMKILDYFFLLRPTLFFSGITIYLLALFPNSPSLYYISAIILFQAVIYLYNQLYDKESDKINHKLFYLADDIISDRNGTIFYRILLLLLIFMLFFTNRLFSVTIITATILLNYLYSHPRYNWKGKPYLSAFSAFCGGSLGYLSGYFTREQELYPELILGMLPAGIALLTAALLGMQLDLQGDKEAGKITLAVKLGSQKNRSLILIVTICGLLISLQQSEIFYLISFLVTLISQLVFPKKISWQLKSPILVLSLSACWYYPGYFLYIAVYFVLARVYYKKRFDLIYP